MERIKLVISILAVAALFAQFDAQTRAVDPLEPPTIRRPLPQEYSDAKRLWQGIPSLEVAKDGGLWVCWYSGGQTECEENYVLLACSQDQGETWSAPILAVDPETPVRAFDPTIWRDPNGALWLFWAQGEFCPESSPSIWDGRVGVWTMKSFDSEKGVDATWTAPRRLCNGIMMGKPLVDSQNRWLFPVAIWRFDSKYQIDPDLRGADLYVSTDQGETFDLYGRAEVSKELSVFDEHHVIEKEDRSFWLLNRTTKGIGESRSFDRGRTWSKVEESRIKHTSSRFFIRRLASGNLVLIKNGPLDQDVGRSRLTAYLSTDDGDTWQGGLVLDERDQTSYPDGGQNSDGVIFATYDFQRYDAREIYVARFTEEDVLAGKIVSDVGRLKMLVNRASGER